VTSRLDKTDRNTGKSAAGAPGKPGSGAVEDSFAGDFAKLKLRVIRPAFDALADWLKARGNEVEISEEPDGNISMRIVPAGVDKSTGTRPVSGFLGSRLSFQQDRRAAEPQHETRFGARFRSAQRLYAGTDQQSGPGSGADEVCRRDRQVVVK